MKDWAKDDNSKAQHLPPTETISCPHASNEKF
jgi:hypothetical protein